MSEIRVVSQRLILEPRTLEEMERLCDNERDAEMKQAYLEMCGLMRSLPGRGEWGCDWCIRRKDGVSVGGIGFKGAPDAAGRVELGYGIDEPYRRRGYATEAVGALLRWALEQDGVVSVTAQTEPDNGVSQRVLLRNGFVHIGSGAEGPLFEVRK